MSKSPQNPSAYKLSPEEIEPYRQGYRARGVYLPRVTSILGAIAKPQLEKWKIERALDVVRQELSSFSGQTVRVTPEWIDELMARSRREPERIASEAADVGTRAHDAIFKLSQGIEPQMDAEIIPCVEAFSEWKSKAGIEIEAGEVRVASLKYGYAGTLDGIGRKNGELILLDWKTSKAIYREYAMQVAAYCKAWEEMFGESPKEAIILRFPKEGPGDPNWTPFESKTVKDIDLAFSAFLAAKQIYDGQHADFF